MRYLLQHYLEDSARRRPDSIAIVDGEHEVTYRDLDHHAGLIAYRLAAHGVARGDRVGIYAGKSHSAVAALYGVLKAGGVYVPIDIAAPVGRVRTIAEDAGLSAVVTDSANQVTAEQLAPAVLLADELDDAAGNDSQAGSDNELPHADPVDNDLAYLLYTSGSTGVPKGVMISHRNSMAFVDWAVDELGIQATDRLSGHAPLHFDLSVFDLFAAACAGATLVLVPPKLSLFPVRLSEFIDAMRITVWYSVPTVLVGLARRAGLQPGSLHRLRLVLFAGEVFPISPLRALMSAVTVARFVNLYGPTETNVCTWQEVTGPLGEECRSIPVGRAIANTRVWAELDDGTLVGPGETGELYVHGATVMRGYWNDPVESQRRLVKRSRTGGGHELAYRTGDLVRRNCDGTFTFVGRTDSQIKRNGYRIEPGEIENAINTHAGVAECAVVASPSSGGEPTRITAHVVTNEAITADDILLHCGRSLPTYLLPDDVRLVDDLPRTSTGKITRRELGHP